MRLPRSSVLGRGACYFVSQLQPQDPELHVLRLRQQRLHHCSDFPCHPLFESRDVLRLALLQEQLNRLPSDSRKVHRAFVKCHGSYLQRDEAAGCFGVLVQLLQALPVLQPYQVYHLLGKIRNSLVRRSLRVNDLLEYLRMLQRRLRLLLMLDLQTWLQSSVKWKLYGVY